MGKSTSNGHRNNLDHPRTLNYGRIGVSLILAERALRHDDAVTFVESDAYYALRDAIARAEEWAPTIPAETKSASSSFAPNDPLYYAQYWTHQIMRVPDLWKEVHGSAGVVVAVVDKGIRFEASDLAGVIANDGYDFVSPTAFSTPQRMCDGTLIQSIAGDGDGPDADPTDPDDIEYNGSCWNHSSRGAHGLWTAGIIAGIANNGAGVAGIASGVSVRPIRTLGITGDGSVFDIAQAILYAAGLPARGAGGTTVQLNRRSDIINVSLGGYEDSQTLRSAVRAAVAAGSLIVASAGNDATSDSIFPAAYPGVVAVGAVGQDGSVASYSNVGNWISVVAPGGEYRNDANGGGGVVGLGWDFRLSTPVFVSLYGTSAAAPNVSGVAALLLSANPGTSSGALKASLESYASRRTNSTRSDNYGWGVVNAFQSLHRTTAALPRASVSLLRTSDWSVVASTFVAPDGSFQFCSIAPGSYQLLARSIDSTSAVVRGAVAWAAFQGSDSIIVGAETHALTSAVLGNPRESEPNDDRSNANKLASGTFVTGVITAPDIRDMYRFRVDSTSNFTIETSGITGACGLGVELDTVMELSDLSGRPIATNDNVATATSRNCSRIDVTLPHGEYFITVKGTAAAGLSAEGRYRLALRRSP